MFLKSGGYPTFLGTGKHKVEIVAFRTWKLYSHMRAHEYMTLQ